FFHRIADSEAGCFGARREVLETFQPLRHVGLCWNKQVSPMSQPITVIDTLRPVLKRIGAQVIDVGDAQFRKLTLPDTDGGLCANLAVLFDESNFPISNPDGHQVPIVAPIEERFSRRLLRLSL